MKVKKNGVRVEEEITTEQRARYTDQGIEIDFEESGMQGFRNDLTWKSDFQEMLDARRFGHVETNFRDAILHGEEISFNTARGHSIAAIKEAINMYIMQTFDLQEKLYLQQQLKGRDIEGASLEELVMRYLQERFQVYAVRSVEFAHMITMPYPVVEAKVEHLKPLAYHHYIDYLTRKYGSHHMIAVGFSEDTKKYLDYVSAYIQDHILPHPSYQHIYPVLYHTLSSQQSMKTILRTEAQVRNTLLAKQMKVQK